MYALLLVIKHKFAKNTPYNIREFYDFLLTFYTNCSIK